MPVGMLRTPNSTESSYYHFNTSDGLSKSALFNPLWVLLKGFIEVWSEGISQPFSKSIP